MRRKDREVQDLNTIRQIMYKCDVCRVAFHDSPFPYIVPMNFGIKEEGEKIILYFHRAKEGKKMDLIRKNDYVAFEMDCDHKIVLNHDYMTCTMSYQSVVGNGILSIVEDEEEEHSGIQAIMDHYHSSDYAYDRSYLPATAVLKLSVQECTGKQNILDK